MRWKGWRGGWCWCLNVRCDDITRSAGRAGALSLPEIWAVAERWLGECWPCELRRSRPLSFGWRRWRCWHRGRVVRRGNGRGGSHQPPLPAATPWTAHNPWLHWHSLNYANTNWGTTRGPTQKMRASRLDLRREARSLGWEVPGCLATAGRRQTPGRGRDRERSTPASTDWERRSLTRGRPMESVKNWGKSISCASLSCTSG